MDAEISNHVCQPPYNDAGNDEKHTKMFRLLQYPKILDPMRQFNPIHIITPYVLKVKADLPSS
jgi:hypothetical protein